MYDSFQDIEKPTLLLDEDRAKKNIDRMVAKARKNGVTLRPHFKTHQSAEVGEWFRERGVVSITVSSVDMAQYFVDHGWTDVTIAFPLNPRQISRVNSLARRCQLHLLVEDEGVVEILANQADHEVSVWLKIDAGYHRTGIDWRNQGKILSTALAVIESQNLEFRGILTHAGNTYALRSSEKIREAYGESVDRMLSVKGMLASSGIKAAVSVGDTPSCSIVGDLREVDEIRPGNFIFYDLSQFHIGSCRVEDISVAVACPIVAKHLDRRQLLIYGGAIHFSKEYLRDPSGHPFYGSVAILDGGSWNAVDPDSRMISISQEHGIVQASDHLLDHVSVGDILLIIPIHSCLTANLLGGYRTLDGRLIEMAKL
jgi:D-serine deaminase-like pyridoxal phosphate-dependent protein